MGDFLKNQGIIFYMLVFLLNTGIFCGGDSFDQSGETPEQRKTRVYHNEQHEGLWPGKADTHLPQISFLDSSQKKIEVTVPLRGSKKPYHYIEAIYLLQDDVEIFAKKTPFSFGFPKTSFTLPFPGKKKYSVVAKCNLHGMWKTEVNTETTRKNGRAEVNTK